MNWAGGARRLQQRDHCCDCGATCYARPSCSRVDDASAAASAALAVQRSSRALKSESGAAPLRQILIGRALPHPLAARGTTRSQHHLAIGQRESTHSGDRVQSATIAARASLHSDFSASRRTTRRFGICNNNKNCSHYT